MTRDELIEALAEKEHASWARWQAYLHSISHRQPDGSLVISAKNVAHWERQIATPYADLTETEKESDRKEVAEIMPIIEACVSTFAVAFATALP